MSLKYPSSSQDLFPETLKRAAGTENTLDTRQAGFFVSNPAAGDRVRRPEHISDILPSVLKQIESRQRL